MNICPFCKEEIPEDIKVCPACGESIKRQQGVNIKLSLKIIILLGIFLILLVVGFGFITIRNNDIKEARVLIPRYESVDPEDNTMDMKNTLETMQTQETIYKNYLKDKHFQTSKDIVLLSLLRNLEYYVQVFNISAYRQEDYDYNDSLSLFNQKLNLGYPVCIQGVQITPVIGQNRNYPSFNISKVNITSPKSPFVKLVDAGEGYFEAEVNYKYFYDNYTENLSSTLQDYLKIKLQEQKDLKDCSYLRDGYVSVGMRELKEWIIAWQEFIEKYPEFMSNDVIIKNIQKYTYDFISSGEFFNFYDNESLNKKYIAEYESFLRLSKPNTEAYKMVSGAYKILKSNNFKNSEEYKQYIYNACNKYEIPPRH